MLLGVHPGVEDPDNPNRRGEYAIVDNVLADVQVAKIRPNVIARRTKMRVRQEFLHRRAEAVGVPNLLLVAPSPPCVAND